MHLFSSIHGQHYNMETGAEKPQNRSFKSHARAKSNISGTMDAAGGVCRGLNRNTAGKPAAGTGLKVQDSLRSRKLQRMAEPSLTALFLCDGCLARIKRAGCTFRLICYMEGTVGDSAVSCCLKVCFGFIDPASDFAAGRSYENPAEVHACHPLSCVQESCATRSAVRYRLYPPYQ